MSTRHTTVCNFTISDGQITNQFHERRISTVTFKSAHLYGNVYNPVGVARAIADSSDIGLLGEQGSQILEIPCLGAWTPMNCRAKCDAASFILGGEILNRTNTHKKKQ